MVCYLPCLHECTTFQVGFCASKCMENEVGTQILKLIIMNTFIGSILDIGCGILFGVLLHVNFSCFCIILADVNIYLYDLDVYFTYLAD